MPKLNQWLVSAISKLNEAQVPSAELDAELILAFALDCNRTHLHANPDDSISDDSLFIANKLLDRRIEREPIAYLLGKKEFYGRDFIVTKDTLIPRPDSEQIIEFLNKIPIDSTTKTSLADIGTGSGCLGITAKLERPELDVTLIDISQEALDIANKNAENLGAKVTLRQNDLLSNINEPFSIIIANLPYVDKSWQRSPETNHEPSLALFAEDGGMELIKKLIGQCATALAHEGILLIEADPVQHVEIIDFAADYNLELVDDKDFILMFKYLY